MWSFACCLEHLGLFESAAGFFARCLAADSGHLASNFTSLLVPGGNPIHAYNRGTVLCRLGQWPLARRDLDLSASLCLARGAMLPPVLLLRRAAVLWRLELWPELWADFALARLRMRSPELTLSQLRRHMACQELGSFAAYRRLVLHPARPGATRQRHWAVQVLAWNAAHPGQLTVAEKAALTELLAPLRLEMLGF